MNCLQMDRTSSWVDGCKFGCGNSLSHILAANLRQVGWMRRKFGCGNSLLHILAANLRQSLVGML
jgi:hypothetical protein